MLRDSGIHLRDDFFCSFEVVSVATPAEPRGEKKLFLVQILGGEKLLKLLKSAGEKLLNGLRGAKIFFKHVSDRFSDLFSRFSNRFSCQIKHFSGAVSFCRGAALRSRARKNLCATCLLLIPDLLAKTESV